MSWRSTMTVLRRKSTRSTVTPTASESRSPHPAPNTARVRDQGGELGHLLDGMGGTFTVEVVAIDPYGNRSIYERAYQFTLRRG